MSRHPFVAGLCTLLVACGAQLPAPSDAPIAPPVVSVEPPTPAPTPLPAVDASSPVPAAPTSDAAGPAFDLTLDGSTPGAWSGAQGNTSMSVSRIWGAAGHVFAVGSGVILHSADRGLHWTAAPGPTGWPAVWGSSIDDVYVGGATVVRSTDRGQTWTPVATPAGSVTALWGQRPGGCLRGWTACARRALA